MPKTENIKLASTWASEMEGSFCNRRSKSCQGFFGVLRDFLRQFH